MRGTDPFGLIGQVLDGQFRVDGWVGEGGFSVVYRGHHLGLDEPIAIKCLKLPPSLGSALVESFVRRFRDESRIHYRLSQGNLHICRSVASGTTMAPATSALVPYMVLEWLEGHSLAQEFERRRAQGLQGRPLADAVKLLDPAVEAVAYAHAQGVVHRDLNTSNFFLARTGDGLRLKVLDFGVAKVVSDHALGIGPRAQTLGQIRIFAPAYGAPEQFDDRVGSVGPWTDVYALALVLLETMRDRSVMEGEHLGEFATKALAADARPTPRALGVPVGDGVEAALVQAVSLDPRHRPQDAGELWGLLKNAMRRDAESGRAPLAATVGGRGTRPSVGPAAALAGRGGAAVEVQRSQSIAPVRSERPVARTVRMSGAPPHPVASNPPPPWGALQAEAAQGARVDRDALAKTTPSAPPWTSPPSTPPLPPAPSVPPPFPAGPQSSVSYADTDRSPLAESTPAPAPAHRPWGGAPPAFVPSPPWEAPPPAQSREFAYGGLPGYPGGAEGGIDPGAGAARPGAPATGGRLRAPERPSRQRALRVVGAVAAMLLAAGTAYAIYREMGPPAAALPEAR